MNNDLRHDFCQTIQERIPLGRLHPLLPYISGPVASLRRPPNFLGTNVTPEHVIYWRFGARGFISFPKRSRKIRTFDSLLFHFVSELVSGRFASLSFCNEARD